MLVRRVYSSIVVRSLSYRLPVQLARRLLSTPVFVESPILEHHHVHDPKLREVYKPPADLVKTALLNSTNEYERLHRQVRIQRHHHRAARILRIRCQL